MTRAIFYGYEATPAQSVVGDPAAQRALFLAELQGVGSEGFESQTLLATAPFVLTFAGSAGNITATLAGAATVVDHTVGQEATLGRFNTTTSGAKYLRVTGDFDLTFSQPIAAFGFFGTDIGDFQAAMQIVLTDSDAVEETIDFPLEPGQVDGALVFWGFVDDTKTYTKIEFLIAQYYDPEEDFTTLDIFGFDDMVIGDFDQVIVDPVAQELRVSRGWGTSGDVVTLRIVNSTA